MKECPIFVMKKLNLEVRKGKKLLRELFPIFVHYLIGRRGVQFSTQNKHSHLYLVQIVLEMPN
uniref:Uncharacterized protein n=1 Tax=Lepeophtheirus salmonis TaxID=72036 RepID=A0A0K2UMY2_LEPSM